MLLALTLLLLRELILTEFQPMAREKLALTAMIEMVALLVQVKFQRLSRPVIWSKVSTFKNAKH